MGFHGDLLPDQQFPAQQYRAAPVLGEEPVIISAAVAQPLSQIVAGDAGQHGESMASTGLTGVSAVGSKSP